LVGIEEQEHTITLEQRDGYEFNINFGGRVPPMLMTEPEPLGRGTSPNANMLMAASIGHCMCASLLFCLQKARVGVSSIKAKVTTNLGRNTRGRLRITRVKVTIYPEVDDAEKARRCVEIFEDFCIISGSIADGIESECEVLFN
jgi:uncharacterized OsmC-like protein